MRRVKNNFRKTRNNKRSYNKKSHNKRSYNKKSHNKRSHNKRSHNKRSHNKRSHRRERAGLPNHPYDKLGHLNKGYVDGTHQSHVTHIVDPNGTGTYSHATIVAGGIRYHYGFTRSGNNFIGPIIWSNPAGAHFSQEILDKLTHLYESRDE